MFCPNCGAPLEPGAAFCGNCGRKLDGRVPEPTAQPTSAAPQPGAVPPQPGSFPQSDSGSQAQSAYPGPEAAPATPTTSLSYDVAPSPVYSDVTPVRTDRDVVMLVLLSIMTCGIYSYWYVYQMAQDTNTICEGDGQSTPGLAAYLCLSILTCGIYAIYWEYKLAKRLDENASRYGVRFSEGASDVILWLVLGVFLCALIHYVGTNVVIKNLNTLAKSYNDRHGVTFVRQ